MKFLFTLVIFGVFSQYASAQRSTMALSWATMRARKETTTTSATTTTAIPPGGCIHNWRKYDPENAPNAPSNEGVAMGTYWDGSRLFVARCRIGNSKASESAYINPNDSSAKGPAEVKCNNSTAEYLVDNPDYVYRWVFVRPEEGYENQVFVPENDKSFYQSIVPTRVNLTNNNGDEFSVLGVRSRQTKYRDPVTNYIGLTGMAAVEILTCSTKKLADVDYKIYVTKGNGLCALEWRRFSLNHLDEVVENGLLVGYYVDGAPIYVGRGYVPEFALGFGRLTVNGSLPPGIYSLNENSEYREIRPGAEYLVRNPAYTYSWVVNFNGEPIANSVILEDKSDWLEVAFTRFLWKYKGHDPFTVVQWTNFNGESSFFDPTDGKEYDIEKENVEFLVCNTDGSYGAIQDSYDGECVHRWKYFDTSTAAPMIEGVDAGDYIDDMPMFVGKGKKDLVKLLPGRAMVNGTPGVFVNGFGNNEILDNGKTAQYLFYNESQVYEWEMSSINEQKQNIEDVYGGLGEFIAISRVLLTDPSNGKEFHVVGVTYLGKYTQYYNPITKKMDSTSDDIELLICRVRELS